MNGINPIITIVTIVTDRLRDNQEEQLTKSWSSVDKTWVKVWSSVRSSGQRTYNRETCRRPDISWSDSIDTDCGWGESPDICHLWDTDTRSASEWSAGRIPEVIEAMNRLNDILMTWFDFHTILYEINIQ